ncbi:chmp5 [Symbiodinium pilosum]|uniref:Chmp5 protein n=1 Tax=Symbiodinium pilosum TaxID=2952 RepID=A0A812WQW0_SYMPI|nr:chmp5 [Symbiodinium pilosum]
MTLAELPAPLTRGKRWAKHAAERDQQIQNEIIAIKVLLPNMSDEDIRRCLKEHGGQTDLALSKLLDAQEVDLLGGLLDETEPPKEPKQEEVSTAASQGANLDGQQIPSSQSVYVAEELAEVPKHKAEPKPLGPPESPAPTPSVPSVPKWLPMLQPSDPAELSSKRKVQYDRQTERLKAALGPAPKAASIPSSHDLDVRGRAREGGEHHCCEAMRRLFGFSKEEPAAAEKEAPSLQEASSRIDEQVSNLEAKILKTDEEIKSLVAQGSSNPTAKSKALQAMKKKKMYQQQRDQLLSTQFNVENLAFQQEQAEITAMAVQAMQTGHTQLKDQTKAMDIGAVDKLTDDMAELQDEMKAINEALAQGSMVPDGATDDELANEFAKLEEEMAAMALAGGALPETAAPAKAEGAAGAEPAPARKAETAVPSAPP